MGFSKEKVGDSRKTHPIPLRLRNPNVPRELGGSEGWRGRGWTTIRKKVLERDRNRSTISGFDAVQGNGLQVDHIHPFRYGGKNRMTNLRTTDYRNNIHADLAKGAGEKRRKRSERY